jgi:hypothetical protein
MRRQQRASALNLGRCASVGRLTVALAIACVALAALDVLQFLEHL